MKPIRQYLLLVMVASSVALAAGCVVRGGAFVHTEPVYEPQLVQVHGVWVVENHHQSVFYDSGYYWRYHSGVWHRSHHHSSGWIVVGNHVVPQFTPLDVPIVHIRDLQLTSH